MSLSPDFVNELRKHFTGDIRHDLATRILYSTDASIYQIEPQGVVIPRSQDDLQAAVELAAKYKVPILPRGAGTSLAGQAIGNALILDCSRWLNHMIEINADEHYAIVEPGVVLSTLNAAAAKRGLVFGPDPASAERATMGGVIANNATGAHSLTHGMTADHLISADVLMADGTIGTLGERSTLDNALISSFYSAAVQIREKYAELISRNWPRTWRNSAGYRLNYLLPWSATKPSQWSGEYPAIHPSSFNIHPLLASSEGTLAIIQRAKVNLVEKPKHTILAVLQYQSNADACDDVPRLLTHHPSAVELIPRFIIRQARSVSAYARQMGWVVGDPAALLVVEFSGDQLSALKEAARSIGDVITIAESKEDQDRIWNVRKVGLGLLDSRPQSARPVAFIEDCAIPVNQLGTFVREVERILSAHATEGGIYAHASAGCLHIRPILDLKTTRGVSSLRSISEAVLALTLQLGGAMSSEHGDGLARSEFLQQTYGPELLDAMRTLKRAADPDNLLNPGKIIDSTKMDSNLRYGSHHTSQVWDSNLSFIRQGGLDIAIEQCNGQGVCRKDAGVMCPSFQATREEMHSTRGRANLLRALIRGQRIGHQESSMVHGLSSYDPARVEAVAQALDLCLACQGCKAECPSGVDMAKLKFAFQAKYYKTHRRQLRDYVFGYFHVAAAVASSLAPLSNVMMQIPVVKNTFSRILGITDQRPFPKFSARRAVISMKEPRKAGEKIIFVSDAFSRYIEPEVEQAAFNILSTCGYDIHVLTVVGAGASFLSKGFIDQARRHAEKVLDALTQIDPRHQIPVVGIEPPEIYCLKHDYVDLLPERASEIEQLSNVWLLDEFLLRSEPFRLLRAGREAIAPADHAHSQSTPIQFHPHCHQRAEGLSADGLPTGTNATLELLQSCGYPVKVMDTGCCGMAGTFGYEAEHYEVSIKVAELKLFPQLRAQAEVNQKSTVISSGAACRMQIRQGTGVRAVHPIELVADFLNEVSHAQK